MSLDKRNFPNNITLTLGVIIALWGLSGMFISAPDISLSQRLCAPFQSCEGDVFWFGTDALGRSVFILIQKSIIPSLLVGSFSMLLASLIGTIIGASAGLFGNHLFVSLFKVIVLVLMGFILFYGSNHWNYFLFVHKLFTLGCLIVLAILFIWSERRLIVRIHLDNIVLRVLEVFSSIPKLMIILAVSPIISLDYFPYVIVFLALFFWPGFAKLSRSLVINIKNEKYIKYTKSQSYGWFRVYSKHLIRNISGPIIVALILGTCSAIVLDSTLSFLGVSGFNDQGNIGTLLGEARRYSHAYWLALFPGLALFAMLYLLYSTSRKLE